MSLLNVPGLAPQMAEAPVQFKETGQDGSANQEFRIVFELHVLARIKFLHCIDQADHSGMDQIFERHLRRQSVMNSPGDVPDLRQMLEKQTLALLRVSDGLGHQSLRSVVIHRITPRGCTEMPGGISVGERTTSCVPKCQGRFCSGHFSVPLSRFPGRILETLNRYREGQTL